MSKHYWLHGQGLAPKSAPLNYGGGIFGGPVNPTPRQGIFKVHYALPSWLSHDNTIGGPMDLRENLPDRCIRPGKAALVGLRDVNQATLFGSQTMRSPWVWAGIIGLGVWAFASIKAG